ncbi:recombination-associated protein RdgC [Francisellaceae bacterium CB300]|jgi:recombination associated protein RdgC
MFFKNLTAFKIESIDIEKFEQSLDKLAYIPCSKSQKSTRGFINPILKDDEKCLHKFNHLAVFCFFNEEKILPAQVINEEAKECITQLEKTRYVSKKEKTEIKEDVEQRLLPQAFSKYRKTYGYIDLINNYLVIDSVSDKQITEIVELLQRCEIKLEPIVKEETEILTEWFIDGSNPLDVELGNKCKLTSDVGDGVANISCQGSSMLNDNIRSFIDANGHITELAIVWREELSMTVNTKLQFKSIKFLDLAKDENEHSDEADLLLMSDAFAELIESMKSWVAE